VSAPRSAPRRWTRERVIAALEAWVGAHGCAPSCQDRARAGSEHPGGKTVSDLFGSWSAALAAAGVQPRPAARASRWSADAVIAALEVWARVHCRSPRPYDWRRAQPDHPGSSTVCRVFGSWEQALRAQLAPSAPASRWTREAVIDAIGGGTLTLSDHGQIIHVIVEERHLTV